MARAEGRSMRKQRGYAPKWGPIMLDLENFYSERDESDKGPDQSSFMF